MKTLSTRYHKAINSDNANGEVVVYLVEITHPEMLEPIRITSDNQAIEFDGNTFQFFPLSAALPGDKDGELPQAQLVVDHADLSIYSKLAQLLASRTRATVNIWKCLADDPDNSVIDAKAFTLRDITGNLELLTLTIASNFGYDEPIPYHKFVPRWFPGLFSVA